MILECASLTSANRTLYAEATAIVESLEEFDRDDLEDHRHDCLTHAIYEAFHDIAVHQRTDGSYYYVPILTFSESVVYPLVDAAIASGNAAHDRWLESGDWMGW